MPPKKRAAVAEAAPEAEAPAPVEDAPAPKRGRRAAATAASAAVAASTAEPFDGLTVALGGGLDTEKATIQDGGGKVAASLTKAVQFLIVTEEEFEKGSAKVKNAEAKELPILKPSFVEAVVTAGDWKSVKTEDHEHEEAAAAPESPVAAPAPVKSAPAAKSAAKSKGKSAPEPPPEDTTPQMRTLVKKGKAPLDPFLSMEPSIPKSVHVYEEGSEVYDAMLNQTNIAGNNNKFYVIQLLQDDSKSTSYCFTRWGRVGVPGQSAVKAGSLAAAKAEFLSKFKDKTKNNWADRAAFVVHPNKYTWLEMNYDDGEKEEKAVGGAGGPSEGPKVPDSKLDPRLRELIDLICDTKMMEAQMKEIGFDARKMPLGKLSSRIISEGYEVLKEISDVLEGRTKGSLATLSSRFYTVIPHDFGFQKMHNFVIDSLPKLKAKMEMVQSLGDIELATRVLGDAKSYTEHPADAHYAKLKNELTPLDADDPMVQIIKDYVATTHGKTHNSYDLEVEQVFETDREGEDARFRKVGEAIGNKALLWHGSRLTNFVGILSQGLRIAPPEAPVTGYMFGKGVYFADVVSKSANYCFTSPDKNTGLMLLCEVALGKPRDLLQADYHAADLPAGTHSTKGCGRIYPDPTRAIHLPDGVTIPMGPNVETAIPGSSLYYNEFIVYDIAQIKMKYLLKLNFKYKTGKY